MSGKGEWTSEEEEILRQQYPATTTEKLAIRLGRSPESISMKATRLGLKKNPPEKPSGFKNTFEQMSREETKRLDKIDLLSVNWSLLEMYRKELSNPDLRPRDRIRLMHAMSSHTATICGVMRGTEDQLGSGIDLREQLLSLEYDEEEKITPRRIRYKGRTYTRVE